MAPLSSLLALAAPLNSTQQPYTLKTDMSSHNFFHTFDFFADPDPTHGFVAYQNRSAAIQQQLAAYIDDHVFLGVDASTKDARGRAALRMQSRTAFNTGLLVADLAHMPANECGVWPAFWLLGPDWPRGGEIDVLENVNDAPRNAVALHTSAGCVVDNGTATGEGDGTSVPQGAFSGTLMTANCDVDAPGQGKNVGCSVAAPAGFESSYGAAFNANGGGVYALEWTDEYIQVFFFPRDALGNSTASNSSTPLSPNPDPSTWGQPLARFSGSGCDFSSKFRDLKIVFNTAFCGEWAGSPAVWAQSCAAKTGYETCDEYVRENPEVFAEAYWEIRGLKWFERGAGGR